MNEVFASYGSVEKRCAAVPGWMDAMKPAIVREEPGHGYWFDKDHPAWQEMWKRNRGRQIRSGPVDPAVQAAIRKQIGGCRGCGDHNPLVD
jgi:hypothetical protein